MGSCRIAEPLKDCAVLYPGGHIHSTSEVIQASKIMRGEFEYHPSLAIYMFRGWGLKENKRFDYDSITNVIIEISSIKNYIKDEVILHIGYEDNINRGELQKLDNVIIIKETEEVINRNLLIIKKIFKANNLLFISHNTLPQISSRYKIAYIISSFCESHKISFIDPTPLVAEYGVGKCFPKGDSNHYTDFFKSIIKRRIIENFE